MSGGVGWSCGLDLVLLRLWRRPAATALIRPLAWELPHAVSLAPRSKTNKQKQKKKPTKQQTTTKNPFIVIDSSISLSFFFEKFIFNCHESNNIKTIFPVSSCSCWVFNNDFYLFHDSWFTVFCQFLLYSQATQSHIHKYSLFPTLSSIMFHHKWLDTVSWAIQQDLIAYPF